MSNKENSINLSDLITFHNEDVDFELNHQSTICEWLNSVVTKENNSLEALSFIFCSDKYLHKLNVEYLQHDTLTDVITFPYSPKGEAIQGDIFISLDRVYENASIFNTTLDHELQRVMVHGVLHLAGYGDKTEEEIEIMRSKEDFYLALIKQ